MTKVASTVQTYAKTQLNTDDHHKKIGLLGGTFNPIHNGHLIIAEQVIDQLGLDEIRFMPDFMPPHVDKKLAIDAKDRVTMINGSIRDNPHFAIEMEEIARGGTSYSYDTLVALKRRNPNYEYYFIIGGDMVEYLPKWHKIDELAKLVTFVGVKRSGYKTTSKYPIIWVDVPFIDISSTLIRSKVRANHSIRYLVPTRVEKYIRENGLYAN
ncbi:nicotinate-nucleotide adenylyltransferase [Lentilactobacillus sp. SPB1-3]|uniref:Nicotinate-nucleotide adenylyltransferase n=1 Tax=Lentilactobacillus terminaliae TaxID=3003483 RepID=A0ACD5DHJ3_9LACO|nr:nicotinate-nucleotide adenylyltransferase [Lentilactobacillus sp. SPB1-3]MCZ0977091.1 nicotinate-nucleotide adenylyltransferase [Lentilactobacillus sp. SPB1-3]